MPEHWHESTTMTWVSNDLWTMEALREKKRKHDDVGAGIMNFEEEPLSEDAAIYQTAVDAMTPTRLPPDSPIEQGGAVVLSKTRFSLFLCNSIFYSKSMFVFGIGRLLFEFCCYICCSKLVCFLFLLVSFFGFGLFRYRCFLFQCRLFHIVSFRKCSSHYSFQ